jgi:hypothetical protein
MPSFIASLKDYLTDLGHGPFALGNLPDSPRDVIAIYDTGGLPSTINEAVPGAPESIEIQFRARNASQEDARAALLAIQSDLHRLTGENIGEFSIFLAVAIERPAVLTRDAKENWHLVSTYEIKARSN